MSRFASKVCGALSCSIFTISAAIATMSATAPLVAVAAEAKPADIDVLNSAAQGDVDQLKNLLAKGGNPDAVDNRGISALRFAIVSGKATAVEALLDAGAKGINEVTAMSSGGKVTPIYVAGMRGQTDVVRALLSHGADPQWRDERKTDIVFQLVNWPEANIETLSALLDSGVKLDNRFKDGATYLMAAALTGKPEVVQLLLDRKANPNDLDNGGYSALAFAISESREDVIRLLLANGARADLFDAEGYSALDYMKEVKDPAARERIRLMLVAKGAPKANWNRPADEALLTAVRKGDIAAAERAFRQGADLHMRISGTGHSALHQAVPYPAMVKFLLDRGINIQAWSGGRTTALHTAAWDAPPETFRLLVAGGLNVNSEHKYGSTPLSIVIKSKRKDKVEITSLLLQLGADPNHRMANGEPTMLAYAQSKGLKEIETLLINAGAKVAQQ